MSCENCKAQQTIDGVVPGCDTDRGCLIPSLDPEEHRIAEMRRKLIVLKELIGPDAILKMYRATKRDIEMLANIEEEIKNQTKIDKGD